MRRKFKCLSALILLLLLSCYPLTALAGTYDGRINIISSTSTTSSFIPAITSLRTDYNFKVYDTSSSSIPTTNNAYGQGLRIEIMHGTSGGKLQCPASLSHVGYYDPVLANMDYYVYFYNLTQSRYIAGPFTVQYGTKW